MSDKNAQAHYSTLGNSITVRIDLDDLPKEQQIRLFATLLVKTGTLTALRTLLGEAQYALVAAAIDAAVVKWEQS